MVCLDIKEKKELGLFVFHVTKIGKNHQDLVLNYLCYL